MERNQEQPMQNAHDRHGGGDGQRRAGEAAEDVLAARNRPAQDQIDGAIFDFGEPTFGSYKLGNHSIWIERAKGNPKGHPEMGYTLEIACSLLKRSAVCWMTVAGDDASLKQFEGNAVTLDGDFFLELVPATAFEKKPGA